jgi:hypothetical protein
MKYLAYFYVKEMLNEMYIFYVVQIGDKDTPKQGLSCVLFFCCILINL